MEKREDLLTSPSKDWSLTFQIADSGLVESIKVTIQPETNLLSALFK